MLVAKASKQQAKQLLVGGGGGGRERIGLVFCDFFFTWMKMI